MNRSVDISMLHKEYSQETGNNTPAYREVTVYRKKGEWFFEESDWIIRYIASEGILMIPDDDYIDWLENKIIEFKNLNK